MAAEADWSIALGILIFIIAIVAAIIFYVTYRKVSLVFFVAAIATYIFSVFYTWDVYALSKNLVLALLVISTLLMIGLGKYFSSVDMLGNKKVNSRKKKK